MSFHRVSESPSLPPCRRPSCSAESFCKRTVYSRHKPSNPSAEGRMSFDSSRMHCLNAFIPFRDFVRGTGCGMPKTTLAVPLRMDAVRFAVSGDEMSVLCLLSRGSRRRLRVRSCFPASTRCEDGGVHSVDYECAAIFKCGDRLINFFQLIIQPFRHVTFLFIQERNPTST